MPAARPSQASVANAVKAAMDSGLIPESIDVAPDGSFRIALSCLEPAKQFAKSSLEVENRDPLAWEDVCED